MASLREILSFIINADASQAIREFDKLEKSSTASLGKMEKAALGDKLARTGAVAGGIALVAGAGLVNMASAAADLDRSMGRVNATFGKGAKDVERWAKSANEVFLSDRQAMRYAAALGETAQGMGLAADQAGKLVPNVLEVTSQLAVLKGMNIDDAMHAISSAMIGEYDATQRLIPALNQRRINEEALAASGKESEKQLTSAEKTLALLNIVLQDGNEILAGNSDALNSAAADWEKLKSKLDDVKTSVGAGVLDVFGPALDGLAAAADQLERIPDPVKQTFGAIAAGAVALAGVVSVFSFIGSGAIKAVGAVRTLNGALIDADGSLTKLGKTASVFSAAGVAFGIYEIGRAINDMTKNTTRFDTALNELKLDSTAKGVGKAFAAMEDDIDGALDDLDDTILGTNQIKIGEDWIDIDDAEVALKRLKDEAPELLGDALTAVKDALDTAPTDWFKGMRVGSKEALEGTITDLEKFVVSEKKVAEQTGETTGAQEEQTDATKDQEAATKALTEAMKDAHGALAFVETALGLGSARAKGFSDAIEGIATDELVEGALDMGDAFGEVKETLKDLPRQFDESKAAMGGYTEAQTTALTNLLGMGAAIREQAATMLENGRSAQEVASRTVLYRDALAETMKQAGLTTDQIAEYQRVMGLTDEDILTTIKLSGDAEARYKLELLQGQIDDLPKDVQTKVTQQIITGDYQGALATVQNYYDKHPVEIRTKVSPPAGGREALLGQTGVGGTAAPASIGVVNVYMPTSANGNDVVAALRRHEARNGRRTARLAPR